LEIFATTTKQQKPKLSTHQGFIVLYRG